MSILTDTLSTLRATAEKTDTIIVAYSGGKESRATMELCSRAFKRIIAFHMYFVPGLRIVEESMQFARDRWGAEIMYYPHWAFLQAVKSGLYCDPGKTFDDVPEYKLQHVHTSIALDTGLRHIAHGGKKKDGLWRKWSLNHHQNKAYEVIYPVLEWTTYDVFAFLKANDIPIPDSAGKTANGIGLDTPTLLWIYDNYPDDFERIQRIFPYIEAVVKRREWYGITG